jgi:hypothetical protein
MPAHQRERSSPIITAAPNLYEWETCEALIGSIAEAPKNILQQPQVFVGSLVHIVSVGWMPAASRPWKAMLRRIN